MLFDYILEILIIGSLGVVIYILARALPRVGEAAEAPPSRLMLKLRAFWASLPLQKIDAFFSSVLEKFLRKARVVILKIENAVSHGINKVKSGQQAKTEEKPGDLFDKK